MRVIIQRVLSAQVIINQSEKREIEDGLLVFLGIEMIDDSSDISWLVNKVLNLRIFNDNDGIMNKSLIDVNGDLMVVSQFTLMSSTQKGNLPSYIRAAKHGHAIPLYESFLETAQKQLAKKVVSGIFGANMQVSLVNDGPVTIQIDSKNKE